MVSTDSGAPHSTNRTAIFWNSPPRIALSTRGWEIARAKALALQGEFDVVDRARAVDRQDELDVNLFRRKGRPDVVNSEAKGEQ